MGRGWLNMRRAVVIQICQNDFLRDKNFFFPLIKTFNFTITELLHHTLFAKNFEKYGSRPKIGSWRVKKWVAKGQKMGH